MTDPFWPLNHWHWWALAVALAAIEVMLPSTFLLWPAMAAVAVGFIALFLPGFGWAYQLMIYSVLAVVTTVLWLQWFKKHPIRTTHPLLNRRTARLVGREALVVEAIRGGIGVVRVDDTAWRARTESGATAEVGQRLHVTGFEGNTRIVAGQNSP